MDIQMVPVQTDEVDALRDMALRIFYASFSHNNTPENMKAYTDKAYSREQLLSELQDPRSEHYFIKVDEKHAGFLKLNRSGAQSDINDPQSMEIQRIYVDMAFQNRGLGKVMLDKAIDRARALDLHYIWLGVWEHNPDAIRFYERHGFSIFGKHQFVMGDDLQTDILMKRSVR
jgi:ribosomal protein S18 acetylase RimI-like enzyme